MALNQFQLDKLRDSVEEQRNEYKFKPNIYQPDTEQSSQETLNMKAGATGYISGPDGKKIFVSPEGTTTNFPTSRDIQAQPAVQPAITTDAPVTNTDITNRALQPIIAAKNPVQAQPTDQWEQFEQRKQEMVEARKKALMFGKDPTKYVAEEGPESGMGTNVILRKKTKEEQARDWEQANTMATIGNGVTPITGKTNVAQQDAAGLHLFEEKGHLDDWAYMPIQPGDTAAVRNKLNYTQAAKEIQKKILQAMPMAPKFKNVDDVRNFVQSLGIDSRYGRATENAMTQILEKSHPELLREIESERKVNLANDQQIYNYGIQHPDIAGADNLSRDEVVSAIKNNPQAMAQMQREGLLYTKNPVTKEPEMSLTPEMNAEREVTKKTKQVQLEKEANDRFVAQHNEYVSIFDKTGKPKLMTRIEFEREKQKDVEEQALKQQKADLAAERLAFREQDVSSREKRIGESAQEKSKASRIAFLERRLDSYDKQMTANMVLGEKELSVDKAKELNDNLQKKKDNIEKELETLTGKVAPVSKQSDLEGDLPVMTPEQVEAAPSGTRFRTPDGRTGTRK